MALISVCVCVCVTKIAIMTSLARDCNLFLFVLVSICYIMCNSALLFFFENLLCFHNQAAAQF